MKKTGKIVLALLVVCVIVMTLNTVFAVDVAKTLEGLEGQQANTTKLTETGGKIITILQTVGIIAAVVVLVVLGIKYMMGSAEEKAEYKKTFIPYIIGAVLIFGASAFAKVIFDFATGL